MKKLIVLATLLSFLMMGFYTSCKKKDTEITCNLSKSDTAPSDMPVTFKAVSTGDGAISTLTYQVGTTTITVTSPSLPWSVELSATANDAVSITATGTTKDGSLTISYDGTNATNTFYGEDNCSHSN
jgi:hypothetical protein